MSRSWSDIVDEKAGKFELAAMFNGKALSDAAACEWLACVLRQLARIADRDARERARIVGAVRFFGLKFTVSRDG
jgi:hypothetical protein